MNCHACNDRLWDYLDETLEPATQAAVKAHLDGCPTCRAAGQREQARARSLRQAIERETAPLTLSAAARQRILAAALPVTTSTAPTTRGAWHWLAANPLRSVGLAALVLVALFAVVQMRRAPLVKPALAPDSLSYSIDVPMVTESRVVQVRDGMLVDAVITQVVVSHAQFPATSTTPAK